jgi:ribosomal protein S18 acetylase RimI-like enzyme
MNWNKNGFENDKEVKSDSDLSYKICLINTYQDIRYIIEKFDQVFQPSLSKRIPEIGDYAKKLKENSSVYAAVDSDVIGFISFYANDKNTKIAYINQIAIDTTYQNKGIGNALLNKCMEVSINSGMTKIKLEVYNHNKAAIQFYIKNGFVICGKTTGNTSFMVREL